MKLFSLPFLLLSRLVWPFEFLSGVDCVLPKYFSVCSEVDFQVYLAAEEVFADLRAANLAVFFNYRGATSGELCSRDNVHFGTMYLDRQDTNILVANELVWTPTTLYNVLLHESLHSLGLDHAYDKQGVMNYAVTLDQEGNVVDDSTKLWPSFDDLSGVYTKCFLTY